MELILVGREITGCSTDFLERRVAGIPSLWEFLAHSDGTWDMCRQQALEQSSPSSDSITRTVKQIAHTQSPSTACTLLCVEPPETGTKELSTMEHAYGARIDEAASSTSSGSRIMHPFRG